MSSKRYAEELKIEAVKQVTEGGYRVTEVAQRLGVTKSTETGCNWLILDALGIPETRF